MIELPGETVDVAIVGAGPVGLLLANILGAQGVRVLVIERLPELIDYPRGVGIDDESLRALQAAGLAEAVLPHIGPNQWAYYYGGKGQRFATVQPRIAEFGWQRRNSFIQPLVDRVLADGLGRFPTVALRFGEYCDGFVQDAEGVTLTTTAGAARRTIRARYLVGCDGGRSAVRKTLGIAFEGKTEANRWLVVDLRDDPIGSPGVHFHCTPPRPHVSIALPHGIRRLEFRLFDGEAPDDAVAPALLHTVLGTILPGPAAADMIRARVYTHSGRLAVRFRQGRAILAGDAAHIMPVWQGQGYNSGVRDAFNLGWKLALVLRGVAGDALLDTYGIERRSHAAAMIALSQAAGRIMAPTNPWIVRLRDMVAALLGTVPPVKRYVAEMRFKPIPRFREGALHYANGFDASSPVGRMFIQPQVAPAGGIPQRLDDLVGAGFALIAWGTNPLAPLSTANRALLDRLGTRMVTIVPPNQVAFEQARVPEVLVLGDTHGRMKDWFDGRREPVVLLRPDRVVALACRPAELDRQVTALAHALAV